MSSKLDQPQGRGNFLMSVGTLLAGFVAEKVEAALEGIGPKLLRPPGAINELAFLTDCTRCDKCIETCPQGALKRAPASAGLGMGTPLLVPRENPCFVCSDLPCIAACPEKALDWPRIKTDSGIEIQGPQAVRIGLAKVKPSRCIAIEKPDSPAETCRCCVDRCPFPGIAIRLRKQAGSSVPKPEVIQEGCTGCGLCEFHCPAPLPGIVVGVRP